LAGEVPYSIEVSESRTVNTSSHQHRGRILRVPSRKGIWLFDYKDIKYYSRLQWLLHLISGLAALSFGIAMAIVIVTQAKHGEVELIPVVFAICGILWGVLYAPAAIIYFVRRIRGEPTDFFDYEVVNRGHKMSLTDGDSNAPDRG
jgi:hypothetical protein